MRRKAEDGENLLVEGWNMAGGLEEDLGLDVQTELDKRMQMTEGEAGRGFAVVTHKDNKQKGKTVTGQMF